MKQVHVVAILAVMASVAPTRGAGAFERIAEWTVGGQAFGGEETAAAAIQATDKLRVGPGLTLSGGGAVLRPWTSLPSFSSFGETPRASLQAGGLLLDMPLGGFTFTPSFGAMRSQSSLAGNAPTLSLRSQLEVGYQFDNASRLSFGYSRVSGVGANRDKLDDDVVNLSYRLPFSALVD